MSYWLSLKKMNNGHFDFSNVISFQLKVFWTHKEMVQLIMHHLGPKYIPLFTTVSNCCFNIKQHKTFSFQCRTFWMPYEIYPRKFSQVECKWHPRGEKNISNEFIVQYFNNIINVSTQKTYSGSMTFVGLGRLRRRGSGADPLGVSTKSRARVAVEPATFWAVHWYQAASDALARGISNVEAPLSIVMCTSGPGTTGTPSWEQTLKLTLNINMHIANSPTFI
jgi:hypothetical protein